ncbi:13657_t:CDS:2 [Entrophospora sp. SA101]|nr:13657_t:CDS:2 [Entrophospora sp. SA101]
MLTTANHLSYQQKINNGSFYTPPELVNYVWELVNPLRTRPKTLLSLILVLEKGENFPHLLVIQKNSLINIKRAEYGIKDNQKLIIIGNPPYNDTTSLKAEKIKENAQNILPIDPQIKSRDLGISFLRSYYQLKADYVCVLHPLSYLVKETNFNSLKEFKDNYCLLKSLVIDSKKFSDAKGASFPVSISLYQLDKNGMDYEYIRNFPFQLENGKQFSLNSFQFLTNLVDKYPKKTLSDEYLDNLFFFTFRDINSIMRNRTFIQEFNNYSETNPNFDKFHKLTLNKIKIVDEKDNPTGRYIYELSDLLVEILRKGFVNLNYLRKLLQEVQDEKKFIEDELEVYRTHPKEYKFNGYTFWKSTIGHPLLIYEVSGLILKIEIIIKEKQKAIGIQPMLYLCIPIKLVEEYPEIENQLAETKQTATYLITKNNFQFVIETIKIFSILEKAPKRHC